ncbi:unnamed protein product [Porites evermanni]|uniref:Uncharacterized protein n=1 Tax=Porites evermanni TaxID=104178 RepID=A0ABN8PRS4_9CNID|nr:unnamed protein product [Porites evermanni]
MRDCPASVMKTLYRDIKEALQTATKGFGGSSQGFANFLLFCVFTEQFKTRLRGVAQKLFVCCLLPIKRKLQDSSRYSGEETPMIETRSLADSCHNNYETYD